MEILKIVKSDNEFQYMETVEIFGTTHKWISEPSDNYSMIILGKVKPQNEIEYTNEIIILGEEKPKKVNEAEERDSIILSSIEKNLYKMNI